VRGVDASLLAEWERLRDPEYRPEAAAEVVDVVAERPLIADRRAFTVLLRNAVFGIVRVLAMRDYQAAAVRLESGWTADQLRDALAPYYEDHQEIAIDPRARGTRMTIIDESPSDHWNVRQTLCDPEQHDDWFLDFKIDLTRSNEEGRPMLELVSVGS
jgi:hypothetical protein